MVQLKKKVTIKTKSSAISDASVEDKKTVTLKRKQPEQVKKEEVVVPPTPPTPVPGPTPSSNVWKIGAGIAVAAVLIGAYFFVNRNSDGEDIAQVAPQTEQGTAVSPSEGTEDETTVGEQENIESEGNDTEASQPDAETKPDASVAETSPAPKVEQPATAKEAQTKVQPKAPKAKKTPKMEQAPVVQNEIDAAEPISNNVEENARRVIRGDFGNGDVRKNKLGSAYPEIQGRVNEMYRQGLVD